MTTMEQEALRRAQEMHSHTSRVQSRPNTESHPVKAPDTDTKKESPTPPAQSAQGADSLFADKEKLLILVLIMLLSTEENSDPTLTLALLYLII